MNNTEYTKQLLRRNTRIVVDTSTLMNYESLKRFIKSNESSIVESGKKIIVPDEVWLEMMRHLGSSNREKQLKASYAINTINLFPHVFTLKNNSVNEHSIHKAFADAALLSELINHKNAYRQLLITNDKMLSQDAYRLNDQKSCIGRRIEVCYINYFGQLRNSDCTRSSNSSTNISNEVVSSKHITPSLEKEAIRRTSWTSNVGVPLFTFATGVILGKHSNSIIRIIKTIRIV